MKSNKLTFALMLLFLLLATVALLGAESGKPRILILHSYDPDYAWTRDINVGLNRELKQRPDYVLRWHYMDLKRQSSEDARHAASLTARQAIESWEPDVVVAIDDEAQELVGKFYAGRRSLSIVFAGVIADPALYGYAQADNVTGIMDRKPLAPLKDALLNLHRSGDQAGALRVLSLTDHSPSVALEQAQLQAFDWAPLSFAGSVKVDSFDEWKTAVTRSAERADVLMLGSYRKLRISKTNPGLVPAREVIDWTEKNAPIPAIGTHVFNVEDGLRLAIGASPFEQGQVAGKMVLQIIDQQFPASSLPTQSGSAFIVAMRATRAGQPALVLPPIYEAFARGTNSYFY